MIPLFCVLAITACAQDHAGVKPMVIPLRVVVPSPHAATDVVVKWREVVPKLRVSVITTDPGKGDSMRPDIEPNDQLLWAPYTRQPLEGKVVSINRGKHHRPWAHKVIAETEHQVLTKGINNTRDDGWTSKAWVQGVLVCVVRVKS